MADRSAETFTTMIATTDPITRAEKLRLPARLVDFWRARITIPRTMVPEFEARRKKAQKNL